ncbi:LysR family transcriptional regulator [Sorangium sp. So ce327]|uniref:helix-turn-helix domain-containing protein n=1 Tax=Sorangium sp. So ce327 TaxID=3133301 RepID=UPI003F5F52AA
MIDVIIVVNLSSIDLNLLHVLAVTLEERSATRAARRLGVTQSAVSNALARARELLGDPLLVRDGHGMAPTPAAEELLPELASQGRRDDPAARVHPRVPGSALVLRARARRPRLDGVPPPPVGDARAG